MQRVITQIKFLWRKWIRRWCPHLCCLCEYKKLHKRTCMYEMTHFEEITGKISKVVDEFIKENGQKITEDIIEKTSIKIPKEEWDKQISSLFKKEARVEDKS